MAKLYPANSSNGLESRWPWHHLQPFGKLGWALSQCWDLELAKWVQWQHLPGREGLYLQRWEETLKAKGEQRCSSFLLRFFSLGQTPIFGVSRQLQWAANTVWARPVTPAKTNNLDTPKSPSHRGQCRPTQRSCPRCPKLSPLALGSSGNAALCSSSRVWNIHPLPWSCATNSAAFPKENIPNEWQAWARHSIPPYRQSQDMDQTFWAPQTLPATAQSPWSEPFIPSQHTFKYLSLFSHSSLDEEMSRLQSGCKMRSMFYDPEEVNDLQWGSF